MLIFSLNFYKVEGGDLFPFSMILEDEKGRKKEKINFGGFINAPW
jgi:hypothetical protein